MSDGAQGQSDEHRLIIAGFGGQGVLTLGRLLCMAGIEEGKQVTYLPSYGSEVRGGTANCQVVISRRTVYSPLVERADSLIILNELSFERFAGGIKPGGLILANTSIIDMDAMRRPAGASLVELPATDMAAEMGDLRVANVLMLGAFAKRTALVAADSCAEAIRRLMGARRPELLDLNLRALVVGAELAS